MDPRIRIRTKMSWIRNTDLLCSWYFLGEGPSGREDFSRENAGVSGKSFPVFSVRKLRLYSFSRNSKALSLPFGFIYIVRIRIQASDDQKFIFKFSEKIPVFGHWTSRRNSRPQDEPPARQRERPALQNMKSSFFIVGAIFASWNRIRIPYLNAKTLLRRKVRLLEYNAKCRYLKKLTCNGTLRQVFYLSEALSPPMSTYCMLPVCNIVFILKWY